jgi:TFIIF-interacting CTD phosphatase-like protein
MKLKVIQSMESNDITKEEKIDQQASNRSNSAQSTYRSSSNKKKAFSKIVTQTITPQAVSKKKQSTPNRKITSAHSLNLKYLLPPKKVTKKTLVLDLDETLIHSNFEEFPKGSDIKISVKIDNILYRIFAMKRPGVEEFLERMGKLFEVVIYTASHQQVSLFKYFLSMLIKLLIL